MEKEEKDKCTAVGQKESDVDNEVPIRYPSTIYILLPVGGLMYLLFKQNIFNRLILQLDRRCLSVFCPSLSRREKLLKWATKRLPVTWSSHTKTLSGGIADLWTDGSLLCTLINTAIPGACPNPHRHWNKPPSHAQAIAYKYLGVVPMFTEDDLAGEMTANLERNFLVYLNELQLSVTRINDKIESITRFSSCYIPRGMGLFSGEQYRKTDFYIYLDPEDKTSKNCSSVIIQIRGPYGTYGEAVVPPIDNKYSVMNGFSAPLSHTISVLPAKPKAPVETLFSLKMEGYEKHFGDNIVVGVTIENNRAKVTYIPKNYGMYEINMIANGELLKGCPYNVHIFNNTSGVDESLENEVPNEISTKMRKKKVISKTIDFDDKNWTMTAVEEKCYIRTDASERVIKQKVVEQLSPEEKLSSAKDSFSKKNISEGKLSTFGTDLSFDDMEKRISDFSPIIEVDEREINRPEDNNTNQELILEKHNLESVSENNNAKTQSNMLELTDSYIIMEVPHIQCLDYNDYSSDLLDSVTDFDNSKLNKDLLETDCRNNINEIDEKCLERHVSPENTNIKFSNFQHSSGSHQDSDEEVILIEPLIKSSRSYLSSNSPQFKNVIHDSLARNKQIDNFEQTRNKKPVIPDIYLDLNQNSLKPIVHSVDIIYDNQSVQKCHPYSSEKVITDVSSNNTHYDGDTNFETWSDVVSCNQPKPLVQNTNESQNIISPETDKPATLKRSMKNKLSRQEAIMSSRPTPNKHFDESMLIQADKQKEQKYIMNHQIKVNKLRIPETFLKNLENLPINRSTKRGQINENGTSTNNTGIKTRKPLSSSINHHYPTLSSNTKPTSPICPDHIEPEVEYQQLSVAEKRKIFSQSAVPAVHNSCTSTVSRSANIEIIKNNGHYEFEDLSVLNVLHSLKEPKNLNEDNYSLTTTMSMPNISLESEYMSSNLVKTKKEFWESLSSMSSLSSLHTFSPSPRQPVSQKKNPIPLSSLERDKLIWSRTDTNEFTPIQNQDAYKHKSESHKSADDILSTNSVYPLRETKNYKSMDNSLDQCSVMSIEERKRLLLKQDYEKEKIEKSLISPSRNVSGKFMAKISEETDHLRMKNGEMKIYNSDFDPSNPYKRAEKTDPQYTRKSQDTILNHRPEYENSRVTDVEDLKTRSQFRKAVNFFKNLEKQKSDCSKSRVKSLEKRSRRLSLDLSCKRNDRKKGGSLNLPSVSDIFSIENLYEDVFRSPRGSYRGIPNRRAVLEALSKFAHSQHNLYRSTDTNEEDIKFDLFKKRAKVKRRKSVKSVFNVNY